MLSIRDLAKTYESRGVTVQALRRTASQCGAGRVRRADGAERVRQVDLAAARGGAGSAHRRRDLVVGRASGPAQRGRRAILRRKQIGLVFQFFNLIGNLSVADNVEMPGLLAGWSCRGRCYGGAKGSLGELGIKDRAASVPSELSGGEQQRVAIARALINQPSLLLADEPTVNLNTQGMHEVLALLRQYHAQGQTILLVSHDARVASAADRVVYLRDGQIKEESRLSGAWTRNRCSRGFWTWRAEAVGRGEIRGRRS